MSSFSFVLRRRKGDFVGVLLLSLVFNTGMTLLTPLFLKEIFDHGIAAKDMRRFIGMMAGFVVIATVWRLLNLVLNLRMQKLKHDVLRDLTLEMMDKYYRLAYAAASAFPAAYCASRIYDEPMAAASDTIDLALEIVAGATAFVAAALLLAHLSPRATTLLAACVPPLLFLADKYGSQIKREASREKEEEGRLRGFVTKAVEAYRSVNLFGLEPAVRSGLSERLADFTRVSFQRFKSSNVHNTVGAMLMSYAEVLVIVACGFEMMNGRMTFGGFMAFMSAFWTALGALRGLTQKAPDVAKNDSLVRRMRNFLSLPEATRPTADAAGELSLKGVWFGYDGTQVLSGLDLTVGGREKVLLSGKNGSGKSTVANILSSFLSPSQGTARTLPIERISACLAPHRFIPGTVGLNLGVGALSESKKRYLERLLGRLDLKGTLDRDPDELSSGQRKKVEILMGLMKDADLYIFDEPLANVDAESKPVILDLIFERVKDKALVAVMHGDDDLKGRFDRAIELRQAGSGAALPAA